MAWEDLVRLINAHRADGSPPWSVERLTRAVKAYVADGFLDASVLSRARPRSADGRLMAIFSGIAGSDPSLTLQAIADRLEAMRERTPRGRTRWQPSSVRMLLERAKKHGML